MSSMYREQIMDHYKHPRNFGELPDADVAYEIDNPLCGDKLNLQIRFEPVIPSEAKRSRGIPAVIHEIPRQARYDVLVDIKFTGTGCAISLASASLLTEYLKNKNRAELLAIDEETIYKLLGVEINPGRVKCALLPLVGLKQILDKKITPHNLDSA